MSGLRNSLHFLSCHPLTDAHPLTLTHTCTCLWAHTHADIPHLLSHSCTPNTPSHHTYLFTDARSHVHGHAHTFVGMRLHTCSHTVAFTHTHHCNAQSLSSALCVGTSGLLEAKHKCPGRREGSCWLVVRHLHGAHSTPSGVSPPQHCHPASLSPSWSLAHPSPAIPSVFRPEFLQAPTQQPAPPGTPALPRGFWNQPCGRRPHLATPLGQPP